MMFSRTVRPGKTRRPSGTWATPSFTIARGPSPAIGLPSNRIFPDQAGNRAQGGRFSGAVRAEQSDDGAFLDRKGDAAQRFDLAVVHAEVRDFQQRHHEAPR